MSETNMSKWLIVTDSSCDLPAGQREDDLVPVTDVPFVISIDGKDYYDDDQLDTLDLVYNMEQSKTVSRTACPSPERWAEQFRRSLQVFALTISSQLSGSMSAASAAAEDMKETDPERQITLLDSRSTGPAMVLAVQKIRELICEGCSYQEVAEKAKHYLHSLNTVFALSSFNNLIKNGRMSKSAGFVAGLLGIWGIGVASPEGTIQMAGKARGGRSAVEHMLNIMKERGYRGGRVAVSHCFNPQLAERMRERIRELWPGSQVDLYPTRGLCSFYAERGGLIVSF